MTYKASSPYARTSQTSWYLNTMTRRNVLPDYTDVNIIVDRKYNFRPDLMSYDLYGTVDYWWVLVERNIDKIRNPIYDFKEGLSIWIPSKTRVATL